MRKELTTSELDDQRVELLPARETLNFRGWRGVNIFASNASLAFNAASYYSTAASAAVQTIAVG